MCILEYMGCANLKCTGFAQTGAFWPCKENPNCEMQYRRIPRPCTAPERFCPECRNLTPRERDKQMKRAWKQAHKKPTSSETKSTTKSKQTEVVPAVVETNKSNNNQAGGAESSSMGEGGEGAASRRAVCEAYLDNIFPNPSAGRVQDNPFRPDDGVRWESIGYPEGVRDQYDWRWISAADLKSSDIMALANPDGTGVAPAAADPSEETKPSYTKKK